MAETNKIIKMDNFYLQKESDGMPYEVIQKMPNYKIKVRKMTIMRITKGLFDGIIHPWGHIIFDNNGNEWQVCSDVQNDEIELNAISKGCIYKDKSMQKYLTTDTPKVNFNLIKIY